MATRKKTLNDPIYGFITVPDPTVLCLIDHPWFQRLRHIKQLGMSHLVYPGALHTRFHHALGAMHLMGQAIGTLRSKGHMIGDDDALGAHMAILLHDVGHGPFSHTLEHSLVDGIGHEDISALVMDALNEQLDGALSTGIAIFRDKPSSGAGPTQHVLHQLVSSQLDVDRMDYLNRDSFYTGVSEGVIGGDRIIKMLDLVNDTERPGQVKLVVEEKGIYSIEKFLVARRLMYWQVYLHKTVVSAEGMLQEALRRAKRLASEGTDLFASPALKRFLYEKHDRTSFTSDHRVLEDFLRLDDHDIMGAVKVWAAHPDKVLATICADLTERRTYRIRLREQPWEPERVARIKEKVAKELKIPLELCDHFVLTDRIVNNAYDVSQTRIELLYKDGSLRDIAEASDNLGIQALSRPVEKYYLAIPRWLGAGWFE